jgi:glycosyltransferase involved in cell wall biosynthesis
VIVAVSKSTVEDLVVRHRISRSELVVIANGVEVGGRGQKVEGEGGAEVRRLLGIPAEAFILGSVGRLAAVKGYDRLITALAALQKLQASIRREENGSSVDAECATNKGRRYVLLLVGDGPERKLLEMLAQELGVADRVIIAGYQPDPAPYLNAMDMFILSSRSEGLSVALLEAMAAGVPVAVTDVGENSGVIDHGGCGVVLPDEEGKWAGVLATAVADRKHTDERVEAARKRVRERYSLSATLASYERVYQG